MSDTESENESDLDFSASEDEYVPSEDADSESDEYLDRTVIEEPTSSKKIKKGKPKSATRKNTEDDDDSDSSVENYLVDPNEIDLSSDFFNPNKKVVLDAPKFDCNVGLKLSDSEEEVFEAVPSTSRELYNFSSLEDARKKMMEGLKSLENFQAIHCGPSSSDAMQLLSMGEPSLATKKSSQPKHKDISNSSDESDFEEVEEVKEAVKKSDVEVRIGPADKQKTNKLQADIEASIKRKINRRTKERQLMMHKVHLLSWIAYGNYVNKILNSTKLMEMVVKYIPSEKCYPKAKTDQQFFEQISKWFKTTVGLKSKEQNCPLKCLPPIATSLALQIQSKMAICKKDFVFIFIILLRSIGIQCRLVINLGTVPMRPAAKDLCVISTKPAEKPSSKDKAKKDKESTKADTISSQDKKTRKGSSKSTIKSKLKSRTNSISGTTSEIFMKSPVKKNMQLELDKRKNLKRSVSVQSSSSVNDNAKRSRIQSASSSKELITQNGRKRSTSVQKPTSTTSKASKLSLNKQESVQSTVAPVALNSPISHHTRMGLARKSSVAGSPTIPQLDGGDDKKRKKSKTNLYKIRLPLRARSVSTSSLNATSMALVTPSRERAKSITPSLRLPFMPRSKSKSPGFTSEHASRKSQFEKSKSNDSSSLSVESSSKLETSSIEQNPTTTKRGRRTLYTSPTKPWRHFDQTTSKANINEKLTSEAELQLNDEPQQIKAESSIQLTAEASTPLKQSLNPDEKLTSTTNDTKSASKDSTIPPIKSAASKRSHSKTKSANPDKKLRSTSKEPESTSTTAPVSATKSAASSKGSKSKTKSSDPDKKLRSTSVEPASTEPQAQSAASSKGSKSQSKSSDPKKKLRSTSVEPAAEPQSKSATSSKSSKSKTKSSDPDKKLRSTSIEPKSTPTIATDSQPISAASSKSSKSKTKSANPDKNLRSTSNEPESTSTTAPVSATKSAASSKGSKSKTISSDPDKKLRSTSVEPAAEPQSKSATSSKASKSKTKSSDPDKKLRSASIEPKSTSTIATEPQPISAASSKSSKSKTKSSDPGKKLRSTSVEPASTSTTIATEPQSKSAASSKGSKSKTKSSDPDKKLRSTSAEPAAEAESKSATSSKGSKSKTKSSDPGKKLRSTSVEPASTSTSATEPQSKSAASSKSSKSKTKSAATSSSTVSSTSKQSESKPVKNALKRKATISVSSDSDFAPTPKKKLSPSVDKPLPKQVERLKKRIDRRILSTDDESVEPAVKKDDMNFWIEVYCEAESKWICIDLFKMKVNCVDDVKKKATKPIAYVFAWNNNNKIKDVTPRYCSQWNTTTRKLRVQPDWLDEALSRYREPLSQRCVAEDRELEEIHAQTPIPSSISELKNHPLYVLPRHLLKFEGIYPPNPVPVGFIRDEPIYSRLCVHTLHSREIWVKQARVVKPGEIPYKIVKARPKWDRSSNKMLEPLPLEIFGRWQTGPYIPPTAENGIVPRNAYGNVELFKPEMLPKKTVHLRMAGLNRVCAKLKIDCAQAVVGFDFHGGSSHPTFDGFVVCEEFAELVTERWCEEQEESYRKAQEKQKQRVYDNWKKLIKGVLIRERLQRKYNFAGKGEPKGK